MPRSFCRSNEVRNIKFSRASLRYGFLSLAFLCLRSVQAAPEEPPVQLKLQLEPDPRHPKSIPIRLTVENTGTPSVSVYKPTYAIYYDCARWKIYLNGADSQYSRLWRSAAAPPVSRELIKLDMGEFCGMMLNLYGAVAWNQKEPVRIGDVPGRYTMQVIYGVVAENEQVKAGLPRGMYYGELKSNILTFEIPEKGKAPFEIIPEKDVAAETKKAE